MSAVVSPAVGWPPRGGLIILPGSLRPGGIQDIYYLLLERAWHAAPSSWPKTDPKQALAQNPNNLEHPNGAST
jgi:hypothetical protein